VTPGFGENRIETGARTIAISRLGFDHRRAIAALHRYGFDLADEIIAVLNHVIGGHKRAIEQIGPGAEKK
jgi:hypothetical protein